MSEIKKPLHEVVHGIGPTVPANVQDYAEYAGEGWEDIRPEMQVLPFLLVVQKGSPQINEEKPQYVPNAKVGMFLNTATNEVFEGKSQGLEIVICHTMYQFTEWRPREEGGGFKGLHSADEPLVRQLIKEQGRFKRLTTMEGSELVETIQLSVLYAPATSPMTADRAKPALIACTSTKLTPVKKYITRLQDAGRYGKIEIPMFAFRGRMTTVYEEKDAGDYYNVKFALCAEKNTAEALIPKTDPLFEMARDFRKQITAGEVKVDYETAREEGIDDHAIPF